MHFPVQRSPHRPRTAGAFGLTAPRLDVPLKGARWELFLPPDYSYGGFAGTMSRETADAWEGRFDIGRYSTIAMVGGGAALLGTGLVLQLVDSPVVVLPNGIMVTGTW